jgi:hypothetical protein
MAVFKVLPDVKIAWRDVWIGAIITVLLLVLESFCSGCRVFFDLRLGLRDRIGLNREVL